jgi:hypothetical protein
MALMVMGAACGGGDPAPSEAPTSQASPTIAQERPTSTGALTIVSPENGERISGDTAQLKIDLQGAEVVDQTSTDLQPDEGHLHVVLDGKLVSMTSGTSQLLQGLTPGEHLLQVEFVANDHAPFDPRVLAAVTFEVTS